MKKLWIIVAVLLVFSVLFSCNKKENTDVETDSSAKVTTVVTTEKETENRISQSTLPPLTPEDPGDPVETGGGNSGFQQGDANMFVPETDGSTVGSSLNVTQDPGFGGNYHHAY